MILSKQTAYFRALASEMCVRGATGPRREYADVLSIRFDNPTE